MPTLFATGFIMASVRKTDLPLGFVTPILLKEYCRSISMSSQFFTMPSSVGWLSSSKDLYLDASSPTMIYFNCTSSPKFYSDLSMGLPTREAKDALGKLSPANPIFMQPVPGSHITVSECIWIFVDIYYFTYHWLALKIKSSIICSTILVFSLIQYWSILIINKYFIIILLMSVSPDHHSNTDVTHFQPVGANDHFSQQFDGLDDVSLRQLRERNKQTENAIKAVKSRINYMKNKQEKTVKKVLNVRRKLTSLDEVRQKSKEFKQQSIEEKKRNQESLERKSQFNKLIKDHLKYNKKIVMTLLNHKVQEEVKSFKEKKKQLSVFHHIQIDNMNEDNVEKANRVRAGHIEAHQKRKIYFLDKLKQFKDYKQRRLKDQIKQRERQESLILEMEEKEKALLQRLSVSEKFRLKCQEQYEDAKRKYHSFYEAARGVSRDSSLNQSKAQIFIS